MTQKALARYLESKVREQKYTLIHEALHHAEPIVSEPPGEHEHVYGWGCWNPNPESNGWACVFCGAAKP